MMYIKYIFTRYHLRTSIKSELQSRKNYLEQSKVFRLNWTGLENFDIYFFVLVDFYRQNLICGAKTWD